MNVFISYALEDKVEAGQLHERLSLLGFKCFLAHRDMLPGTKWRDEIVSEIKSANVFIPILTEKAVGSAWVQQESGMAHLLHESRKPILIIPLTVNCDKPPGCLSEYQSIRADAKYWGLSGKVKMEDGLVATLAAKIIQQCKTPEAIKGSSIRRLASASTRDAEYILQVLHAANTLSYNEFLETIVACTHTFAVTSSDKGIRFLDKLREIHLAELNQDPIALKTWNKICKRYKAWKDEEQRRLEELIRKSVEGQKKRIAVVRLPVV